MTADEIERIGRAAYRSKPVSPLKRVGSLRNVLVVGFDTEYDAETRELVSLQFTHEGHELFVEAPPAYKPRWADLDGMAREVLGYAGKSVHKRHVSHIMLSVWWFLAEAQHIVDLIDAEIVQHSTGYDFRLPGNGRILELFDVQKYWSNPPLPLRIVAESYGLRKLDWDRANVSRADLSKPGFREYAMNDAHICEKILVAFRQHVLQVWGVDVLRARTPALSSSWVFRSQYLQEPVMPPHPRVRELAMKAAWGGRNEAYRRGVITGDIAEFDAFSQHPSSCVALGKLPRGDADWREIDRVGGIQAIGGFVDIRFRHPRHCRYPALPIYHDGKLLYVLEGRTQCSLSEARVALRAGARIDVIEGYGWYDGTTDLASYFTELMGYRAEVKAQGDKGATHAVKLLLNSLVGKLAQRTERRDLNTLLGLMEMTGLPVALLMTMDAEELNGLAYAYGLNEPPCGVALGSLWLPEWNSAIIGHARASISAALLHAQDIGCDPLFSSTDALLVNGQALLPDEFECERVVFQRRVTAPQCEIMRTRFYRIGDEGDPAKLAHHAAPPSAAAAILEAFMAGDPHYQFTTRRFVTLRESLTGAGEFGAELARNIQMSTGWDNKRRLLPDGSSEPWRDITDYEEGT